MAKDVQKKFCWLVGGAAALAFAVILLGAFTRLTDSGLGCPDWPGCYGHYKVPSVAQASNYDAMPLVAAKAWTEMFHRYIASTLGLFIAVIVGISFWKRRKLPSGTTLPLLLLLLVLLQGMLGMWTVTLKLHPTIVMLHLLGGFSTLSLLWLLWLRQLPLSLPKPDERRQFRWLAGLSLVVVIGQIFLGGWTSSNYAALICPDFPYCQGALVPKLDFADAFSLLRPLGPNFEGGLLENTARMTIHFSHRLGAMVTALVIGITAIWVYLRAQTTVLARTGLAMLVILCGQLLLGVLNVVKMLPLPIAVAHNGGAVLLLLATLLLNLLLWQQPHKTAKEASR